MASSSCVILGVDPGSLATGWGVIEVRGSKQRALASGVIRPRKKDFNERLVEIHRELAEVCESHRPAQGAIEGLFFQKNPQSALKLGHVRGVAVLCCLQAGLTLAEYSPAQVKQALTGNGRAEKRQVAQMVALVLGLDRPPPLDAADALAVAIAHAQAAPLAERLVRLRNRGLAGGRAQR